MILQHWFCSTAYQTIPGLDSLAGFEKGVVTLTHDYIGLLLVQALVIHYPTALVGRSAVDGTRK